MTESSLMLMAQITDAERQALKRIAKSRGMTLSGFVGQLVREVIRNSDSASKESVSSGTQFGRCAGDIRDSALL